MNTQELKAFRHEVADLIEDHETMFDMADWGGKMVGCGSVHCLGGWTMIAAGYTNKRWGAFYRPDGSLVDWNGDEAAELLGLTRDHLFYNMTIKREDAVRALRVLAETGDESAMHAALVPDAEEDE